MKRFSAFRTKSAPGSGVRYINQHKEDNELEKIALLKEYKNEVGSIEQSNQELRDAAIASLKEAGSIQGRRVGVILAVPPNEDILLQIASNPMITSLEAENLHEKDMMILLKCAQINKEISAFNFKCCELTDQVKNEINLLFAERLILKMGFEACHLSSYDLLWLESILKKLYGVESFTLVESFSRNEYIGLFQHLSTRNLKTLGCSPENLPWLTGLPYLLNKINFLELYLKRALDVQQMQDLLNFMEAARLKGLRLVPLHVDSDPTYKRLIQSLRTNQSLETLIVGDYPGLENDLLGVLISDNTNLISIKIENRQHAQPSDAFGKIQGFVGRNRVLHDARNFLSASEGEAVDLELLSQRATVLINALREASEMNYVSHAQDEIKVLISGLENYRSKITSMSHVSNFS